MLTTGFRLTQITLTGAGVPNAEINFSDGLNVISGPSDTGKTFIVQCIDFMFGASNPPKDIPEAASYDSVLLSFRTSNNNDEFVLKRSLRGGDACLSTKGKKDRILSVKHSAGDEDNISSVFLKLCGLEGRKIRSNKQGKTRAVSFRDIARLILVDEESVINEKSPILSGQYVSRTAESSVFRMMLTGIDDSSVIAKDNPKIIKQRQEGKGEIIEILLNRTQERITKLELKADTASLRSQLDHVELLFDKASKTLAIEQEAFSVVENRRRSIWDHLRKTESRMNVLSELQQRFELLKMQYSSDLRRLEAIGEAGLRLGQMNEEHCPICGASAKHHDKKHQKPHLAPDEIANACHAEAKKTNMLLLDLQSTIADNGEEIKHLSDEKNKKQTEIETANAELLNNLKPRMKNALQNLKDSQAQRDTYRLALELYDRMEELKHLLDGINESEIIDPSDKVSTAIRTGEAEQFSKEVEALLRTWRFPGLDRVTFSEEDQDVVISARQRASHGKGVRAITHAAFNLALLKYCSSRSMSHPGLVVIDSPLVVYREPDVDEAGFTLDLKDAFYKSLATEFQTSQVIIFENDDPPDDICNCNVIKFTGTHIGRAGFIPIVTK